MPKSLNQFFIGQLYTSENNALLRRYQSIIEQITPQCAQAFYEVLLTDHATKRFFTSELVETHLKNELQLWLNETLSEKTTEAECVATIHKQRSVGEIHARIDVPMQLVNSAMSIIKKVLFETIKMHD